MYLLVRFFAQELFLCNVLVVDIVLIFIVFIIVFIYIIPEILYGKTIEKIGNLALMHQWLLVVYIA